MHLVLSRPSRLHRRALVGIALTASVSLLLGPVASRFTPLRSTPPVLRARRRPGTRATRTASVRRRGTASKVWYTLDDGKLTEVYYPRIDTPSIRDSQFVVTDGATFTDREDRDSTTGSSCSTRQPDLPAGQHRHGPGAGGSPRPSSPTRPLDGAGARCGSSRSPGGRYQLYLLHDPALSMTGNDDTGRRRAGALLSIDGTNAARSSPARRSRKTSSGYLGTTDGWTDLRDDHDMDWAYRRHDARQHRADRPGAGDGTAGHQRLTRRRSASAPTERGGADQRGAGALGRGLRGTPAAAYDAGWHDYLGALERRRRPASAAGRPSGTSRRWCWRRARTRPSAAASSRRRRRPWAWANSSAGPRRLPRGVVARPLPDRHRAARGRRRRGARTARSTTCGRGSSAPTARSRRTRGSTARRCSATCSSTRWPSRSCWPSSSGATAPPTGSTSSAAADCIVDARPAHSQERWENADRLLAGDDRRRDRRPGLRRRHRRAQR